MLRRFNKKRLLAVTSVCALALAGIAFAFFSSTGSGTGSGSAASSDNSTIVVHGTITDALAPGGNSSVTFTADNTGTGAGTLRSIHLSNVAADSGHSSCAVADFTMPDVTGQTIAVPAGASGQALGSGANGTISMANTGVSQDACKGATLSLTFTTG
jgi:hypothetical protein